MFSILINNSNHPPTVTSGKIKYVRYVFPNFYIKTSVNNTYHFANFAKYQARSILSKGCSS